LDPACGKGRGGFETMISVILGLEGLASSVVGVGLEDGILIIFDKFFPFGGSGVE
jgi:hypothetical protein